MEIKKGNNKKEKKIIVKNYDETGKIIEDLSKGILPVD